MSQPEKAIPLEKKVHHQHGHHHKKHHHHRKHHDGPVEIIVITPYTYNPVPSNIGPGSEFCGEPISNRW